MHAHIHTFTAAHTLRHKMLPWTYGFQKVQIIFQKHPTVCNAIQS